MDNQTFTEIFNRLEKQSPPDSFSISDFICSVYHELDGKERQQFLFDGTSKLTEICIAVNDLICHKTDTEEAKMPILARLADAMLGAGMMLCVLSLHNSDILRAIGIKAAEYMAENHPRYRNDSLDHYGRAMADTWTAYQDVMKMRKTAAEPDEKDPFCTDCLENDPRIKALIDRVTEHSICEVEDFLGYPVSADILEDIDGHVKEAIRQMPVGELTKFMKKYGV